MDINFIKKYGYINGIARKVIPSVEPDTTDIENEFGLLGKYSQIRLLYYFISEKKLEYNRLEILLNSVTHFEKIYINNFLLLALRFKNYDVLNYYLERGIDEYDLDMAIKMAIYCTNPNDIIIKLLEKGANISDGQALIVALETNENYAMNIIKLLSSHGADISVNNNYVLINSISTCCIDLINTILDIINTQNKNITDQSDILLSKAIYTGEYSIIELLILNGARPELMSVDTIITSMIKLDYLSLELLINNNMDISKVNSVIVNDNISHKIKLLKSNNIDMEKIASIYELKFLEYIIEHSKKKYTRLDN